MPCKVFTTLLFTNHHVHSQLSNQIKSPLIVKNQVLQFLFLKKIDACQLKYDEFLMNIFFLQAGG